MSSLSGLTGLRQRDAAVVGACAARGIPVVGLTAGGYARDLRDTVAIHANTAREVLAWPQRPAPAAAGPVPAGPAAEGA